MLNGNVWRIPEQPADLEQLQKDRFHRAIQDKLIKLIKYKFKGFITVLVLEDIAGVKYQQLRKGLTFFKKVLMYLLVDYIVVLASNDGRMIVGNVWKENRTWHSFIPYDRRFELHSSPRDS